MDKRERSDSHARPFRNFWKGKYRAMKIFGKKLLCGFTLLEMLMSMGCGSLILATVVTAGVALQRSFAAVEGYSMSEGDQLRVLDYIAMDCRRALSATVSGIPPILTLTVPAYYDSNGNAVTPTFNSTWGIQYGTGSTVTITYYQIGNNFVRSVTVGSTTTTAAIATNVSTFAVTPQDLTSTVSCSITFSPRFTYLPGPGPVAGTTVFCNTFLRNAAARQ
jgi:Tfp pilus assembly protein PilW